jgi:hypothetical protein
VTFPGNKLCGPWIFLMPTPRATRRALEEPSTATARLTWPQRYEHLLAAHTHLQQTLVAQNAAHRRKLTLVKYEPSLPNNDVFTKELLAQNRELQQHCRELELRLAKVRMEINELGVCATEALMINSWNQERHPRPSHHCIPWIALVVRQWAPELSRDQT